MYRGQLYHHLPCPGRFNIQPGTYGYPHQNGIFPRYHQPGVLNVGLDNRPMQQPDCCPLFQQPQIASRPMHIVMNPVQVIPNPLVQEMPPVMSPYACGYGACNAYPMGPNPNFACNRPAQYDDQWRSPRPEPELDDEDVDDAFGASFVVNGRRYYGHGDTWMSAKMDATDNALKEIMENNVDEVPAGLLLSCSLYKLTMGWDETGNLATRLNHIIEPLSEGDAPPPPPPPPPPRYNTQPERLHPVTLLQMAYPTATYKVVACSGQPHVSCTVCWTIGDRTFSGVGYDAEEAKKLAAMLACQVLLGITFGATGGM